MQKKEIYAKKRGKYMQGTQMCEENICSWDGRTPS